MTFEELSSSTHNWWINPREYARQEACMGRRFEYIHLEPERTALVVVDMTSSFVLENPYCNGIVPKVSHPAHSLRALALPKPHTPSSWEREFCGEEIARSSGTPEDIDQAAV
jgi:hypothetical protein